MSYRKLCNGKLVQSIIVMIEGCFRTLPDTVVELSVILFKSQDNVAPLLYPHTKIKVATMTDQRE